MRKYNKYYLCVCVFVGWGEISMAGERGGGGSNRPLNGIGMRVVRGESITQQRIAVQYIQKIIPATVYLLQNFTMADCNIISRFSWNNHNSNNINVNNNNFNNNINKNINVNEFTQLLSSLVSTQLLI